MIDISSASAYKVLDSPDRGRVILAFLDAGMEFRDIIDALNCDGDVLTTMLLAFTRSLQRAGWEIFDRDHLPHAGQRLALCHPPQTSQRGPREREKLFCALRNDVLDWLAAFQLGGSDRLDILASAAASLKQTPVNSAREELFSADRVIAEVLGLWTEDTSEEDFIVLAGRWLASWMRFWVSDLAVCAGALERSSATLRPTIWPPKVA